MEAITDVPGVERVLPRADVAQTNDLPVRPEGDVAVFGDLRTAIGTREMGSRPWRALGSSARHPRQRS